MKQSIKNKLFVLALCITNSFCFGQQNRSAVCRLGELTNDSLLPYIQALEVNCDKDAKTFISKSEQFTYLKQVELKGDADKNDWETLFNKLKLLPSVKTVLFNQNTFSSLPYGYEGLFSVENISFKNNEELDQQALFDQLTNLPNIKDLNIEVVTIFELPNKINQLKNIETLHIINTDESISKNDGVLQSLEKEPVTYDYSIKNEYNKPIAIKYTAMAGEIDSDEYKELAKRFTTTNNFVGTPNTYLPKYKFVDPPIKGIDVERKNYTINPTIENIITYPSGTKFFVPANAFIDKNGQPVTTSVTLSYREFRDPVDFLVSGIPMKYDTGGTVTNFESAGMFELTASNNSEEVKLAPDKKIDMNFATTSKDSTYNFYTFNDNTGNWEYLNKPATVTAQTVIKINQPSQAYYKFKYFSQANARFFDSTSFAKRFTDTSYVYTARKVSWSGYKKIFYRHQNKKREKSMYSLVKISNIKKTKEGTVVFKVDYIYKSHPEMQEFNNLYFALNENMSTTEFKQKFAKRKYYNDIRVVSSGSNVELQFKDKQSIKSVSANLVMLDQKGKVKEVKNVTNRMKHYNRRLNSRERLFNKNIAKGKRYDNTIMIPDPQERSVEAYKVAKKFMNVDEKKMTYTEWLDYYKQGEENEKLWYKQSNGEKLAALANAEATAPNLIQSLSLGGMGIYNCDQIQRMKKPVEIFARYKTSDNNRVKAKSAYIIDKKNNSVFQYDGHYGYSANKIAFSKSDDAENMLLAVNEDGSVAVYGVADFKRNDFKNKEHFDFLVTKIDAEFTTVDQLKTVIGF